MLIIIQNVVKNQLLKELNYVPQPNPKKVIWNFSKKFDYESEHTLRRSDSQCPTAADAASDRRNASRHSPDSEP